MSLTLISLAIAPILICAFYIFIRDKYEKEPIRLLVLGLFYGALITIPIIKTGQFLLVFIPNGGVMLDAFYNSFFIAALTEEFFKYTVLFFLVFYNHNFNEKFDGIVYAVFISLGFAGFENVMYVLNPELGGYQTAFARAFVSVPGHALFGVTMGYYFSLIKYEPKNKVKYAILAFFVPYLIHGVYNFILLSGITYMYVLFIPFLLYMWVNGFKKMKHHIEQSPFKITENLY